MRHTLFTEELRQGVGVQPPSAPCLKVPIIKAKCVLKVQGWHGRNQRGAGITPQLHAGPAWRQGWVRWVVVG